MRKAILPKRPDAGTVTVHSIEADCLVEYSDGSMNYERFYDLKFIDTPESEQRAEFAKAAMQGIISNSDWVKSAKIADDFDEFKGRVSTASIEIADTMIAELKSNEVLGSYTALPHVSKPQITTKVR